MDYRAAIWVVTPKGRDIATAVAGGLPGSRIFRSSGLDTGDASSGIFDKLSDAVAREFTRFNAHIFIMSIGIAVRMIGPLLDHKLKDPAVVAVDDAGRFAVSLLSGHVSGANELAEKVAGIINAIPVITTATDAAGLPAVDVTAREKGLFIQNPEVIKTVSMALLTHQRIALIDPMGVFTNTEFAAHPLVDRHPHAGLGQEILPPHAAVVVIDDGIGNTLANTLVLRPPSLALGIGCNRHTRAAEIRELMDGVMDKFRLAAESLFCVASVDLKFDEPGLVEFAAELNLSLRFFSKDQLNAVTAIQNPSAMAEKHIGVKSVCEAAAILAAANGQLIVPKHKSTNATLAVARMPCSSSV
ncbi:MAG: cobalamin biosynthesis protein CbiG [Desulfobacteraceae bacterium]|nr:cobalamin biosynthesis protein CbiG [Desulfobacteraceae bacterium]